jgi:hypothetical protein
MDFEDEDEEMNAGRVGPINQPENQDEDEALFKD